MSFVQIFQETAIGNRYGRYVEQNQDGEKHGLSASFRISKAQGSTYLEVYQSSTYENGVATTSSSKNMLPEHALKKVAAELKFWS